MDIDSLENQLATAISSIQLEQETLNLPSPRENIRKNQNQSPANKLTASSKSSSLTGSTSGVYQSSVSDVVSTYSLVKNKGVSIESDTKNNKLINFMIFD